MAESTKGQYESHLRNFWNFCEERDRSEGDGITYKLGIEFLTKLFGEGKSFSTINSARSAISQFVSLSDTQSSFGTHPVTARFMKGVYKLRPPTPKYTSTWDVALVLNFVRQSYADNTVLDLKHLSFKTAMLIALCSGQRMQTLCALDLKFLVMDQNKAIFHIKEILKTSKPGVSFSVSINRFIEDDRVCPFIALKSYIDASASLRGDESNLFISFQKPHKKITTQTLSRWLTGVMSSANVDVGFGAHSLRHASSSTAYKSGVNINSILSTVGWRNEKTFATFYRKDTENQEGNSFSEAILRQ